MCLLLITFYNNWQIKVYFYFETDLINATLSKDPVILRDAILRAQKQNYNMSLTVQILLATRILERLNRVKKISSTVLEMNQNAITEMKKYQKPPDGVHQSLAATFLLLGEKPAMLKVNLLYLKKQHGFKQF